MLLTESEIKKKIENTARSFNIRPRKEIDFNKIKPCLAPDGTKFVTFCNGMIKKECEPARVEVCTELEFIDGVKTFLLAQKKARPVDKLTLYWRELPHFDELGSIYCRLAVGINV